MCSRNRTSKIIVYRSHTDLKICFFIVECLFSYLVFFLEFRYVTSTAGIGRCWRFLIFFLFKVESKLNQQSISLNLAFSHLSHFGCIFGLASSMKIRSENEKKTNSHRKLYKFKLRVLESICYNVKCRCFSAFFFAFAVVWI